MKLCKDCTHCKVKPVGYVSYRAYCDTMRKDKRGILLHKKTPHPHCPLKENRMWQEEQRGCK